MRRLRMNKLIPRQHDCLFEECHFKVELASPSVVLMLHGDVLSTETVFALSHPLRVCRTVAEPTSWELPERFKLCCSNRGTCAAASPRQATSCFIAHVPLAATSSDADFPRHRPYKALPA